MCITVDIPWKRYALIAELAKKLETVSPQFGKTVLQKIVYLLQEVYKIDCGYNFELYSYGPFDSQLLGDLDLVEHWGCVSVQSVNDKMGGYCIKPTEKVDLIREKATDFLDASDTQDALLGVIDVYGGMTAKQLELRATTIYVEHNLRTKTGKSPSEQEVCQLVGQIKPKFTSSEIQTSIDELKQKGHIELVA